ncbi:DUF4097 family beta strand repeat-containing protein [Nonomuraea sp. SBT364]|uniref:DUF4097 family beta strand repeat-containing protein n=1 Tax=Nonomuraea sp. SBT364 TaxID=1580530 RepID=UPI00066C1F2A|nr:DUF4097 family beta strand repeat-containing protein [Nonomuraea sp. SBT364]
MPTFDSPEPILALVDVAVAHIWINASDRADTVVEIRPGDQHNEADVEAAEHIHVEYTDGRLVVRAATDRTASASAWGLSLDKLVESPSNWARSLLHGWSGSVDVSIDLPTGSRVDARTAAGLRCRGALAEVSFTTSYGDIQVEQARRLRLKSTHGDISVTRSTGHAEVTNTNGDIRIGEIDGTAVVKTAHGEIRLREVTGELRLSSAHGDSVVDRALGDIAVKTAYGSVRIGDVASGSVVMETTGGGLELGVREGSAAWLDLSSKYGTVDVSLDPADDPGPSGPVVEVRAHTVHGDIDIHRS